MTSGTSAATAAPAPTTAPAPTARDELKAALATVSKLLTRAHSVVRTAEELNDKLPAILARLNVEEAADNVFVRAVAKTPQQVAAKHANEPEGSRPWWVVFVGREPGLYTTVEEANLQIKGCPGQEYRRKTSKPEALAFYELMYSTGKVEKWVELVEE
ncbi:hypothetical protein DFH09DRAFT_1097861 [Mycena vulgaris]|nr:hypothetical protein DFH09DRAFT_1346007 [Mycena vulgaris]KAJ6521260.1 hypothetical protein DFH09DRAFT_1097861 [Mycena vulgaris]